MDHLYGENQNVPPERTLNFGENGTQNRTQAYPEVPKRTQYWDQERLIFGYKWVPLGTILGTACRVPCSLRFFRGIIPARCAVYYINSSI